MYILGINGGVRMGYRDASAVLLCDGKIVAAIEEERLNRIKSSPHQLPELSIRKVLDMNQISMREVAYVATHGSTWGTQYETVLKSYLETCFGYAPPIKRYHHHDCHAAGTFFSSGYKRALIVTIDNSGDGIGTQIAVGEGQEIKVLERIPRPNSLGMFYGLVTQFCGFVRDSDEYKLMGLAPFGEPKIDLSQVLRVDEHGFELNLDFIQKIEPGQPQPSIQQPIYSAEWVKAFGLGRLPHAEITSFYKDFAASAQWRLEEAIQALIRKYVKLTGISKICIAGGVGLNCTANKTILEMPEVESLFVQPASGDAGISQGAAYLASIEQGVQPHPIRDVYWGKSYLDEEIQSCLQKLGVHAQRIDSPADVMADLVASGQVVAWFQGGMEFGPRALGNRSILANPLKKDVQSIVNQKIKFREGFRPFCPSLLAEDFDLYFEGKQKVAPYMTINYKTKTGVKEAIPGVVHVNHTARIQTVDETQHESYHQYLKNLKALTGHGVSLNTSFNVNRQPIVENPFQAVSTFYGCGLDTLVMGHFLLRK